MGKHAKLKEKQKWSDEKLHLETHENCEGSISSTPRIRSSKKPSRTRLSWKHQWLLLCPAKLWKIVGVADPTKLKIETCVYSGSWWIHRNAYGKFDTASSWRPYCRKRWLQHYNVVHKFIPMPQAVKFHAAKAAVDKEWEKLEKVSAWNLTKVESKKQVIDEARTSGATVHFASLWTYVIWKMLNWRQSTKIQRSSCTPWWYWKRRFRVLCSIHWTRIFSISNDSS